MVDFYKRVFRDICVTTNAFKSLYESSGEEDKGWGDADVQQIIQFIKYES